MTALKREAIQLVEQMPEDQMPYVIRYIQTLKGKVSGTEQLSSIRRRGVFWETRVLLNSVCPVGI